MQLSHFALTGNPITEEVTSASALTRTVIVGGKSYILQSDSHGGKCRFRYDGILRTGFADERTAVEDAFAAYEDKNLFAEATINGTSRIFVRGVSAKDEAARLCNILTTLPEFRVYNGFEFSYSFLADGDEQFTYTAPNGSPIQPGMGTTFEGYKHLTIVGNTWTANAVQTIGDDGADIIKIRHMSTPAHPFWVRWINNRGGFDYWMFTNRQQVTRKLSKNEYFEQYGELGQQTSYNKECDVIVEASSGLVDNETFYALSLMAFSPDIRYFNTETNAWEKLQISNGDSSFMTDQPTGEMIVSFLLPKPLINK